MSKEEKCKHPAESLFVEAMGEVVGQFVLIVQCNDCAHRWGTIAEKVSQRDH